MTRLLGLKQVAVMVGRSTSTVSRWLRENRFPQPVVLPKGLPAWRDEDVEDWIANLPVKDAAIDAPAM